jgi:hypothetical protein
MIEPLVEDSALKIFPFLASHNLQTMVCKTKGQSLASRLAGTLAFQISTSDRSVT